MTDVANTRGQIIAVHCSNSDSFKGALQYANYLNWGKARDYPEIQGKNPVGPDRSQSREFSNPVLYSLVLTFNIEIGSITAFNDLCVGQNLGNVDIHLLYTDGKNLQKFLQMQLQDAYIVRWEVFGQNIYSFDNPDGILVRVHLRYNSIGQIRSAVDQSQQAEGVVGAVFNEATQTETNVS